MTATTMMVTTMILGMAQVGITALIIMITPATIPGALVIGAVMEGVGTDMADMADTEAIMAADITIKRGKK